MKQPTLIVCLLLSLGSTQAQTVVFNGIADKKYEGDKVVLYNNATQDHDSAVVKDGRFSITVSFKGATRYFLMSKRELKDKGGYVPFGVFVTGPGVLMIDADMETFSSSKVSGSPEQDLYTPYAAEGEKEQTQVMDELTAKYGKDFVNHPDPKDSRYKQLLSDYDSLSKPMEALDSTRLVTFIQAHPASFVSVFLLDGASRNMDISRLESLYAGLDATYRDTKNAKHIVSTIAAMKITAIGQTAPDFSMPDTAGQAVKLSDFRGKYVLLDFWASWCGPCRAENPNVVKIFNEYKGKNFTILSVSLDQPGKKDAWLNAIHKDGLTWTHVSDLKFWNSAAVILYGISAVPSNFLLDPEGKIIGKNLRGEELDKKLHEIFL